MTKLSLADLLDKEDPDNLFTLEEEIASGAFGTVYKGTHIPTKQIVAVKIITPEEDEAIEDLMVEIDILKKCQHENIVKFYGAYKKGEEIFIAMELCDGGAVNDIFNVIEIGLSENQIAFITREALKGLVYLHEKNIIHRDIKGANVLLTGKGDVKLVDFGVSFQADKGRKAKTFIGTPYWMAPEVIAAKTGLNTYEFKADIWSIGIMCIELAETNPPLSDIHPMRALFQIPIKEPPKLQVPSQWSKEFNDFLAKCLVKDPKNRPTAKELLTHPFLNRRGLSNACALEIIQKRKNAEASGVGGEDLDEESTTQASEMDEDFQNDQDQDDLEVMEDDGDMSWLNGSDEKPQTAPTMKPSQSHMMNSEDWANSDEEDDDGDDYGRQSIKKDSTFDPFNPAALQALERESKKRPVAPARPTPTSTPSTSSTPSVPPSPGQSTLNRPAPTSKLARPPPRGSLRGNGSSAGLLESPQNSNSSSENLDLRGRAESRPPARAPPPTPQNQAKPPTITRNNTLGSSSSIDSMSESSASTPKAPAKRPSRTKSKIMQEVEGLNQGRSTLARPSAGKKTTIGKRTTQRAAMGVNNEMNKKMVKQQMKELRALQEKQKVELHKRQKAAAKELADETAKYNESQAAQLKTQAVNVDKLKAQQKVDLDSVLRQQAKELKLLEKKLEQQRESLLKDMANTQKTELKHFNEKAKVSQKQEEAKLKADLKKEKTLNSKQVKQLLAERIRDHELKTKENLLIFQHDQTFARLLEDHKAIIKNNDEKHKMEQEQLKQIHQLHLEHLQQQHQQQDQQLRDRQQVQNERDHHIHPMQLRHEQEEQQIVFTHLEQTQQIEWNQQAKVLDAEKKRREKEFKNKQKQELEEHKKMVKNMEKTADKSRRAAIKKEAEAKFAQHQAQQTDIFYKGIQKERDEEENQLRQFHEYQRQELRKEHFRRQDELQQQNQQQQLEHQKQAHEQTRELRANQHKEQLELLTRLQQDLFVLLQNQYQQKLTEQEKQHRARIQQLETNQEERRSSLRSVFQQLKASMLQSEMARREKDLEAVLAKEMENLKTQLVKETQQLQAETENQKNQLQQYQQTQKAQLAQYQNSKVTELIQAQQQEVQQLKSRQEKDLLLWAQRESQRLGLPNPYAGHESYQNLNPKDTHRAVVGPTSVGRGIKRN